MTTASCLPLRVEDAPVVWGDTFDDDRGVVHELASVSITLTCTSGVTRRVELERRGDKWWAPDFSARPYTRS